MGTRTEGWPLLALTSSALIAMVGVLLVAYGLNEESVRVLIRATARTSVIFFCAAVAASSLLRFFPSVGTRWLVRKRRPDSLRSEHQRHNPRIVWNDRDFVRLVDPAARPPPLEGPTSFWGLPLSVRIHRSIRRTRTRKHAVRPRRTSIVGDAGTATVFHDRSPSRALTRTNSSQTRNLVASEMRNQVMAT